MSFGFPPFFTDRITIGDRDPTILRESVREIINALGFSLFEESKDQIVVNVKSGYRSWGEMVHINFLNENTISVTSKSKFAFVDWGKNKSNVKRLCEKMLMNA